MKKIIVIGNSFGTDITRYLYGVARSEGVDLKVVNLYIGGCSLYRHYRNMLSEEPVYSYELNGHTSGIYVSLKAALLSDEWDRVIMQQCSPASGDEESYQPFATEIAAYVRRLVPKAKLFVNQTWTFDTAAPRFKLTKFTAPEEMFPAVKAAYEKMARDISADGIIPSGEAMFRLWQRRGQYSIEKVHRDGFHAELGVGRYLLALTAFASLTGKPIADNAFCDFDVEVTPEAAVGARAVADEVLHEYGLLH